MNELHGHDRDAGHAHDGSHDDESQVGKSSGIEEADPEIEGAQWEELDAGEHDQAAAHATEAPVTSLEGATELSAAEAHQDQGQLSLAGATKRELPHRAQMEHVFGAPLGGVDAHVGADLSNLDADGAAQGDTVAFADSDPAPGLVAHEVAHVMQQQRAGRASGSSIAPADSHAETEADQIGSSVARGNVQPVNVSAAPAGGIHLSRRRYAKTDKLNKDQNGGRPGVAIAGKRYFKLTAEAVRYKIANGTLAEELDRLPSGMKIEVNISTPRTLHLPDGTRQQCVYARSENTRLGAGWMPASALGANARSTVKTARRAAREYGPARAGKLRPDEYVLKAAGSIAHPALALAPFNKRMRDPSKVQNRAKFSHYLDRPNGLFPLVGNLPQEGTPPIPKDQIVPGVRFYVQTTRAVQVFRLGGARPSNRRWAFGCVGKQNPDGSWEPDRTRSGWLPVLCLDKR